MSLYILRWNPLTGNYKPADHKKLINHMKKGERPLCFNWSVHDWQSLEAEDMFILQQVGTDADGIVMIGSFRGNCFEEESWRRDGKRLHYADMFIWDAFSCGKKKALSASHFEKLFPEIDWHGGHSGVKIDEDTEERLIDEIQKVLIRKGLWNADTYMDFLMADHAAEVSGKEELKSFMKDGLILLQLKHEYREAPDTDKLMKLLWFLKDSEIIVPMNIVLSENDQKWLDRHSSALFAPRGWKLGDEMTLEPDIVEDNEGGRAYPMFTNMAQLPDDYGEDFSYVKKSVVACVEEAKKMKLEKLVLDPFTAPLSLPMEVADIILDMAANS
ncbi:MAG: SseB family protein [Treponema sp.]|nr:SseB family protein [Candidatus Treponema caballi]